jgi:LCP family protein required for cell wall assembly
MTDELDPLRRMRSDVAPPSAAVHRAARARWNSDMADTHDAGAPRGARTFALRTAIAGVVAVAIVAGAWLVTRARIDSVKPSHVVAVGPLADGGAGDPQVFLLVGSDARDFSASGQDAARADTIALVRVEPKTGGSFMLSIPRDLAVTIPGHGVDKINAAFADGGMPLLVATITENLGVPINHTIEVGFSQFAALVDELGGIRIDFPAPARDRYSGLAEPAGCRTLSGSEALAFVRSRHYEFSENGQWHADATADLGRIVRQQVALRQLANAAESRVSVDPRPELRSLFAYVTVDSGFTADDALRVFSALRTNRVSASMTLPVYADHTSDGEEILRAGSTAQVILNAFAGGGRKVVLPTGDGGHRSLSARDNPAADASAC